MSEILLGAAVFTVIVMILVLVVSATAAKLMPSGGVNLTINGARTLPVPLGGKLARSLEQHGVYLPAACGGRGTCGQCRVTVLKGGGAAAAVERSLLTANDLSSGVRLACQLAVRGDLEIKIPAEALGVKKWTCTVRSSGNVATLMRELVLELPPGEVLEFCAGSYVQVVCPPHSTRFADFDIGPEYRDEWNRLRLWPLAVTSEQTTTRAYSLANHPGENKIVMLVVRIATPPPGAAPSVPPGVVSSYLFGLKPGDKVEVSGPFGTFHAIESNRETVFVGGGAGMAPMRSLIFDQLKRVRTTRTMTFWYGARNLQELFYREDFDRLAAEFSNFHWFVALSEPRPHDAWQGETGFIHEVLYQRYLRDHPAPEECEYYVCGPPMMMEAVRSTLDQLGVDPERIRFDDFGG